MMGRRRYVLMLAVAAFGALGLIWLMVGPDAAMPDRPLAVLGLTLLGMGMCKEARRRLART